MKYQDIRSQIQSFDILLFSGRGLISRVIKIGSGSKWSHVALALRLDPWSHLLCYESTTLSNVPDLTTGAKVKGVQLVQLSARLENYEGDVAWRHIEGERTPKMMHEAAAFMREFQGRPYEQNQWELIKAALDTDILISQNQPDASSVFCSEMAMLMLRRIRMMLPPGLPANEFDPGDSAGDLPFAPGYTASEVVLLV